MKLTRSYTMKIVGNDNKIEFLNETLDSINLLSKFILDDCIPLFGYNQKEIYKKCRTKFKKLNSKLIQNFIKFSYIKVKKKPKNPVKASMIIDYQSFNMIKTENKLSSVWLHCYRRNFPCLGKFALNKIEDFSDVKLVQIYKKNNNLYCKLSYSKEIETSKTSAKAVGLDVNTKCLVLSDNTFYKLDKLYHRKLEHHKNKKNIKNFTYDFAHKLTTQIAKDLSNKGLEVLILEDLKHLRKSASKKLKTSKGKRINFLVNSLPYAMFKSLLTYKCNNLSIRVESIPPYYTSKTCSRCGSLETERPQQNQFICNICGLTLHADLNASRNIRDVYTHPNALQSESSASADV